MMSGGRGRWCVRYRGGSHESRIICDDSYNRLAQHKDDLDERFWSRNQGDKSCQDSNRRSFLFINLAVHFVSV